MDDKDPQGFKKDSKIIQARTIIDVMHIKHNTFFIGDILATADLP